MVSFIVSNPCGGNDSPLLIPAVRQAERILHFDRLLADAGYDSEKNHRFCREMMGIPSTVIPARKLTQTGRCFGPHHAWWVKHYGNRKPGIKDHWLSHHPERANKKQLSLSRRACSP